MLAGAVLVLLLPPGAFSPNNRVPLSDGSVLLLRKVRFGGTNIFLHGNSVERLLRNAIPTNGLGFGRFKLNRATFQTFTAPDKKTWFVAEFQLLGTNVPRHALVVPHFSREFRCVIHGEQGIPSVQEFWRGTFLRHADGYFGYVLFSAYPRDSKWLWLTIERRTNQSAGGPWTTVARFRVKNDARFQPESVNPHALVSRVNVGEFALALGNIMVQTQAYAPHDIWNHVVTAQFSVLSNGIPVLSWDQPYVRAEDASGNWEYGFANHHSLDPRFVWKVDADFEPANDFPADRVATVPVPKLAKPITTNLCNVPVSVSWDGYTLAARISTTDPALALRYVSVRDTEGHEAVNPSGSWNQHEFRKMSFMWRNNGTLTVGGFTPAFLTVAVVTNLHATFYVQPLLDPTK